MTGPQIIVLATPVFLLLIALELWVGKKRTRFLPFFKVSSTKTSAILFLEIGRAHV